MSDPFQLNRLIRDTMKADLRQLDERFGDGIAGTVEGSYCSIRKGDPEATPTPGFYITPELTVVEGDHLWYFDSGGYKLVLKVLDRNAVLPLDPTFRNLTLTGSLRRESAIDLVLTASVDDFDPIGGADAYVWRFDSTGGPWTINGIRADPGAEHLLLNIDAAVALNLGLAAGSSAAENQLVGPGASPFVVRSLGGVRVWYDLASEGWRVVSP